MSPKRIASGYRRQQGFLIPLALFILVGLLALALAASRLTGQSAVSATLEGLSTQAFYAAESGGQYAMHQVFYGTTNRGQANTKCDNLATTLDFSGGSAAGLKVCQTAVSCTVSTSYGTSFYTVTSAASCGSDSMVAERTIEISAFFR